MFAVKGKKNTTEQLKKEKSLDFRQIYLVFPVMGYISVINNLKTNKQKRSIKCLDVRSDFKLKN